MKKKVLLINPTYPIEESPSPPFGLMSLASYLIKNDYDVIIEDYVINPYSEKRLANVIENYVPDVIGATGVTMNIKKSISILKECKRLSPDALTLLGGPHATFDADNILIENNFIDAIVRGEGEVTTVELLNCYNNDNNFKDIKGISYRSGQSVFHNESREFIQDINTLPMPARHLVQLSKYRALGLPINMITSRGCPHECIFCVGSKMVGRKVRYFDIERVVDEFQMLSKLKFGQINIVDDLFTSNKKRCINICKEIVSRGINYPWSAFARVDTVSEELLVEMKKAGCTVLCFGIESGNQEILDRVKKRINLDMCRKAVEMCKAVGIEPMTSYILGLPGETSETVLKTLEFSKELCSNYGYHVLAPFPGTEVRDSAEEYGMKILTDDWDKYDANQSVAESIYLSHEEVDNVVNKFYKGINNFVLLAIEKYNNGEEIPEENMKIIRNLQSLSFSLKLIEEDVVENFSLNNSELNISREEEFIKFLISKLQLSEEIVSDEFERLMGLDCLKFMEGKGPIVSWT